MPIDYFLKKQRAASQFLHLDSTLGRIKKKIEGIHKKFGSLLQSGSIIEGAGMVSNSDLALLKNMRLKDLAKDMKLSIEPCKNFQATIKQALIKGMEVK